MFVALFNVFGDEKSRKNLIQNTWKAAGSSPAGNILFHFFIYLLQFFCGCMSRFLYDHF